MRHMDRLQDKRKADKRRLAALETQNAELLKLARKYTPKGIQCHGCGGRPRKSDAWALAVCKVCGGEGALPNPEWDVLRRVKAGGGAE